MKNNCEMEMIATETLVVSDENPVDRYKGASFEDLVASIKSKGVLMAILVRPKGKKYEVIAGARRVKASIAAGLKEVPARVVKMTDEEAREARIIENLQRADLHPVDEGQAYATLIEHNKKLDIKEIAAQVGKSETYVRNRLVLSQLTPSAEKAYRAGEISAVHAPLVARLKPEDQKKAVAEIKDNQRYGRSYPEKDLREWIMEHTYSEARKKAPWKDDAQMKAAIAEVTGIEGTEKNLFGQTSIDEIEDPAKHALAMAAFIQLTIDRYKNEKKPLTLITSSYSSEKGIKGRSDYELVKGTKGCVSGHDALYVEGDDIGKIVKICTNQKCKPHHPYSYKDAVGESPAEVKRAKDKRAKEREEQKTKAEAFATLIATIVKNVEASPAAKDKKFVEAMCALKLSRTLGETVARPIAKRRGWEVVMVKRSWGMVRSYGDAVFNGSAKMTPAQKLGLVMEILIMDSYNGENNAKAIKKIYGRA